MSHHHPGIHSFAFSGQLTSVTDTISSDYFGDINAPDEYGSTAVHYAAAGGHDAVMLLLIQNGADINATDGEGNTALNLAVQFGEDEVVRVLLSAGADSSMPDELGCTPLYYACGEDWTEGVNLLLAYSSHEVHVKNIFGNTPLHAAVQRGATEIVSKLVMAGGNLHIINNEGKSCLDILLNEVNSESAASIVSKYSLWCRRRNLCIFAYASSMLILPNETDSITMAPIDAVEKVLQNLDMIKSICLFL